MMTQRSGWKGASDLRRWLCSTTWQHAYFACACCQLSSVHNLTHGRCPCFVVPEAIVLFPVFHFTCVLTCMAAVICDHIKWRVVVAKTLRASQLLEPLNPEPVCEDYT
eukprot:1160480-Pelagomonas_calceolata.AAC.2